MEPEGSLPCSQKRAAGLCPEVYESSPNLQQFFFKYPF